MQDFRDTDNGRARRFATLSAVYLLLLAGAYLYTYIPRYLVTLGWSATAVGFILGMHTVLRSMAMPVWAHISDRNQDSARLAKIQFGLAIVPLLAFPWIEWKIGLLLCIAALALTHGSALPMLDSVVIRELGPQRFGRVRAFGSAGFGLAAATVGFFGLTSSHETIAGYAPWAFAAVSLMAGFLVFTLPTQKGGARPVEFERVKALLTNRWLLAFLVLWSIHWGSQIPYNLFLVFLCEEKGFAGWVPGASVSVAILAEVLFLAAGHRIITRFGPAWVFAFAVAATGARWLVSWWTPFPGLLVAVQVVHGLSFGAFLLSVMATLDDESPVELRATAQAALYVIVFGIGSAIGQLVSGAWVDRFDATTLFAFAGGVELLLLVPAIALAFFFARRDPLSL